MIINDQYVNEDEIIHVWYEYDMIKIVFKNKTKTYEIAQTTFEQYKLLIETLDKKHEK